MNGLHRQRIVSLDKVAVYIMLKLATDTYDMIYLWEHSNGGNGPSGLVTWFSRDGGNGKLEKRLGFCWTNRASLFPRDIIHGHFME